MEGKLYNLSNPQKSIWLTEQFCSNTSINNLGGYVLIHEVVNFKILEKALNEYIRINEATRFQIKLVNDEPMQYIKKYQFFTIKIDDLENEEELNNWNEKIIHVPFSIIDSPLYSITMFRFKDGRGGFNATLHHLVTDAWGMSLLISEVMEIYSKLLHEEEILLTTPNYSEFLISEKEYLNSPKFEKDKEFWNGLFDSTPEITSITSTKENYSNTVAKRDSFILDSTILKKITEFCKNLNCSVYTFFMAIYSIYLSKLNSTNTPMIGTPVLNRTNFKEKHTSGMFISTVPFKVNIKTENTFEEFLKNVSMMQLSIFRHQKYPYDTLLEDLKKKYNFTENLYDVVLSYQNARDNKESCDVKYSSNWLFSGYSTEALQIHFYDMDNTGDLTIYYAYQIEKFSQDEIKMLHNRIMHMVEQVINKPSIAIKDIEIVTPSEKQLLLQDFHQNTFYYDETKSLITIFEEQVSANSTYPAIIFEGKKISYQELNKRANQFAYHLLSKNVKPNEVIGIMLPRGFDLLIAILAVLKTGAGYMLIDPSLPEDRINYMLKNSNSPLLITNANFSIDFRQELFMEMEDLSQYSDKNPIVHSSNEDIFCVIYTSGSTGTPKGVTLKKSGILNLVYSHQQILDTNQCDYFLSTSTVAFDMFIVENFTALLSGKTVVLANEEEQRIPIFMSQLIKKNHVDFILSTPSKISLLLLNEETSSCLQSVKVLQLGGEVFSQKLYEKLSHYATNARIFNGYGPSECSACSSMKEIIPNEKITIGKPFLNTNIYILNQEENLLPIGYVGEICISGNGVGKGYIGNPELTAKVFVPNPFKNGTMYKTGDMGKILPNGEIEYIGRKDNQVKLRGLRIELEEISSKILEISGVKSAVSVIRKVNEIDSICAYIMQNGALDDVLIKNYLKEKLPYYMVPSYIMFMDKLPLTLNGKIDTKNLPEIEMTHVKYIAPQTPIEKEIISKLENMLNISNISMNQNFFDLGGDSLCAIKLVSEVYSKFGIKIEVKDIFEYHTLSDLCSYISSLSTEKKKNIQKSTIREYYPLTSAQRGIYYTVNMEGKDSITYNTPSGIFLTGNLNISKLEKCLKSLIQRHDVLRTAFILKNGTVMQKVEKEISFSLPVKKERIENIDAVFEQFVKPFDLSKAPLLRAELICFDDTHYLLLLDIHHIIFDGTSIGLFANELSMLYREENLPENSLEYMDYAIYENEQKSSSSYQAMKNYWKEKLSGDLPVLSMPTNYPRPAIQSFSGNEIFLEIPYVQEIYTLCRKCHTTPYLFLLAVYYLLLYRYTGQEDIIVGTAVAGRDNSNFANTLGMFVNTLALRQNIMPNISFVEFLNLVIQNGLSAFANETYSFDELVKELNVARDVSRNPIFDTMFVYQNEGETVLDFAQIETKIYSPTTHISKFDFSLELIPKKESISARLEYCTSLFTKEFMEHFLNHYLQLITSILQDINLPIAKYKMLEDAEIKQITKTFNNRTLAYDESETLIQIFEKQVAQNPNKVAIRFLDSSITYGELNERANQIAHYLTSKNVKRNQIIGILLPRTPDLLYEMLGILKTGAGYMLIDPSLPYDRILFMLENASSPYLITSHKMKEINGISKIWIEDLPYENYSKQNLNSYSDNEDSFCVIYTSGSSGTPKGVELKRKGVINLLKSYQKFLNTNSCQNFLSMSSVAFDMFIVENFISLLSGGTVILSNEEEQKIPIFTNQLIKKEKVNFILTTPSRMELLLNSQKAENSLKTVKVIQLGGEVFPSTLYEKIHEQAPNAHVFNGYGPTEITACCSSKEITSANDISIGSPFGNTQIWICDKNLNLCPIGVEGELCVSGYGVAKGYIHNLEMTQKNFVDNPFGNGKLYRTGDMAKYKENGEIEYIGREDFQVKIRGLRVELSEIEKQFLNIPEVKNVAVIYKKEETPCLVAFFTANNNLNISNIRKKLSEYLPLYMVPKYIIQLDELPITLNGKINKKQLENFPINKVESNNYVAPTTEIEKLFCLTWEQLLNTKIGVENDVFEMGADSLLAIKFKTELLSHNINVAYADIFKYKTVRELASVHEKSQIEVLENYNFSACEQALEKNAVSYFSTSLTNIKRENCNHILLLGANGFVGSHILYKFIKMDKGTAYCIIRDKNYEDSQTRFLKTLHFYFGEELDSYLNHRIFVIRGDILKPFFGLTPEKYENLIKSIDVVINAAAMVKHYGSKEQFKSMNVDLTQNLIDLCLKNKKRLLHISSLSVSGNLSLDGDYSERSKESLENMNFSEQNLYIGQNLDNEYIKSKFFGEKLVLEAISKRQLQAQILRLGNITSRYSDGTFQINYKENAFFNRLYTFIKLGVIPENLLNMYIEFTPVDSCAEAIITILQNNIPDFSVYHLYDDNHIYLNKLLDILKSENIEIKKISKDDFRLCLTKLLQDGKDTDILSGIINDLGPDKELEYTSNIHILSDFTKAFLYHVGFYWPNIDDDYLIKYIEYMKKLI